MFRLASVLAIVATLLVASIAAASPPELLEGARAGFIPDPSDQPIAVPVGSSSVLKLSETIGYNYSGDISGVGTISRNGVVFGDFGLRAEGTIVCDPCTVRDPATGAYRSGTLRIRQVTTGYIDFSTAPPIIYLQAKETILGGTGELASLRGEGRSWDRVPFIQGFPIPSTGGYTFQAHFDP